MAAEVLPAPARWESVPATPAESACLVRRFEASHSCYTVAKLAPTLPVVSVLPLPCESVEVWRWRNDGDRLRRGNLRSRHDVAPPRRGRSRRRAGRRRLAVVPMIERTDCPPCAGTWGTDHVCRSGCLPILARRLPTPPEGWAWRYGQTAPRAWSVWLQRVGGAGRWHVLGLAPVDTARELSAVLWAYILGNEHQ